MSRFTGSNNNGSVTISGGRSSNNIFLANLVDSGGIKSRQEDYLYMLDDQSLDASREGVFDHSMADLTIVAHFYNYSSIESIMGIVDSTGVYSLGSIVHSLAKCSYQVVAQGTLAPTTVRVTGNIAYPTETQNVVVVTRSGSFGEGGDFTGAAEISVNGNIGSGTFSCIFESASYGIRVGSGETRFDEEMIFYHLSVYDRVLTGSEYDSVVSGALPDPSGSLVYYKFDEVGEDVIKDYSGNEMNLKISAGEAEWRNFFRGNEDIYEEDYTVPRVLEQREFNVLEDSKRKILYYSEEERGDSEQIFVNKFDHGSGGRMVSRLHLDKESQEYSPYNVLGFRHPYIIKQLRGR